MCRPPLPAHGESIFQALADQQLSKWMLVKI
jgi:hypothetical protein